MDLIGVSRVKEHCGKKSFRKNKTAQPKQISRRKKIQVKKGEDGDYHVLRCQFFSLPLNVACCVASVLFVTAFSFSRFISFFGFLKVFEQYKEARTQFVQTVAELAVRPQNIEALQNAGVMALLRPLLLDTVPGWNLCSFCTMLLMFVFDEFSIRHSAISCPSSRQISKLFGTTRRSCCCK